MFDIHAHVLPGIDDGPRTLTESLALLRAFVDDGITHVVATPHIYPGVFDNTWNSIAAAFNDLADHVGRSDLPIGLSFAAEVRLCPEMLGWMREGELPVFSGLDGQSFAALVEFPDGMVPVGAESVLSQMIRGGVTPILAHLERNRAIMESPNKAQAFVQLGCKLQVTAGSLLGEFGERAQITAVQLLENDLVHVVASDAHNLRARLPRMGAARRWLAEHYGDETAERLTVINPRAVAGLPLEGVAGAHGVVLRDLPRRFRPRQETQDGGALKLRLLDLPARADSTPSVALADLASAPPAAMTESEQTVLPSTQTSANWLLPELKVWGEVNQVTETAARQTFLGAADVDFPDTLPHVIERQNDNAQHHAEPTQAMGEGFASVEAAVNTKDEISDAALTSAEEGVALAQASVPAVPTEIQGPTPVLIQAESLPTLSKVVPVRELVDRELEDAAQVHMVGVPGDHRPKSIFARLRFWSRKDVNSTNAASRAADTAQVRELKELKNLSGVVGLLVDRAVSPTPEGLDLPVVPGGEERLSALAENLDVDPLDSVPSLDNELPLAASPASGDPSESSRSTHQDAPTGQLSLHQRPAGGSTSIAAPAAAVRTGLSLDDFEPVEGRKPHAHS